MQSLSFWAKFIDSYLR